MTHRTLRNAGVASITALALALVACGGSSTSTPVAPPNNKPTLQFVQAPTSVLTFHKATFTFIASDADGDATTVKVNGSAVTGSSYVFSTETVAPATLAFEVSDGKGSNTYSLPIVVLANNNPQLDSSAVTLGAGLSQAINLPTVDQDSDNVTWAVKTTPSALTGKLTLTGNTLTINAFGVAAGTYNVVLTGTENSALMTKAVATDRTLAVTVGTLPSGQITAYPSNTTVIYAGLPFTYPFSAGSPLTGDSLLTANAWSLDGGAAGLPAPANATINPTTGKFTWTPAINITLGVPVTFGVRAKFQSGVEAYQTFNLTPSKVNTAPSWSSGGTEVIWPDKLNGAAFSSNPTYGAVLSWPGSTPNSYVIPSYTGAWDSDIGDTDDALTFSITKAYIVGDSTQTDIKGQLPALKYTAGSLTIEPNGPFGDMWGVYDAGTFDYTAPNTGVVVSNKVNLGQTPYLAGGNLTGDIAVIVRATDKGGLTADKTFVIPSRQNAAPVIDNVAKGGAALTSGDDYVAVGGLQLANVWPAYAVANTWTLAQASPIETPIQRAYSEPNKDTITKVEITGATVNGVADTRITGAMSGTDLVVTSPVWGTADARKPYTFTVTAKDFFGAVSNPVTFSGVINGTVTGTQVASYKRLGMANPTDTKFDFSTYTAGDLVVDPFYPTGPTSYMGKFNSELTVDLIRTYKYAGSAGAYSVTSVPGSVYYAQTAQTKAPNTVPAAGATEFRTERVYPVAAWYYGDANAVSLNTKGYGRYSVLAPTAENPVAATGNVDMHFQYVSLFDKAADVFQIINPNMKSFFGGSNETNSLWWKNGAGTAIAATTWNDTNNLSDLDYVMPATSLHNPNKTYGDWFAFGRMTKQVVTDSVSGSKTANLWRMERVAVPNTAASGTMLPQAPTVNATFDPAYALSNTAPVSIARNSFAALMTGSNAIASSRAYASDVYKIAAWPDLAFTANQSTGAVTLVQLEDLSGNSLFNSASTADDAVNFGNVAYGSYPNTTPVLEYTYNWTYANAAAFTAALPMSAGVKTTTVAAVAPTLAPLANVVISKTTYSGATPTKGWTPALVNVANVDPATNGQITLKWDAVAGLSGYEIRVYNVTAAAIAPTADPVATIRTAKNEIMLPTSYFAPNGKFVFVIRQIKMTGVDFNTAPYAMALPMEWADTATGVLTFTATPVPAP